jgi:hypothetical protein
MKQVVKGWNGLIWLRIGSVEGSCKDGIENPDFKIGRETSD